MKPKQSKLELRKKQLAEAISYTQRIKETLIDYNAKLDQLYKSRKISEKEYNLAKNKVLQDKTLKQWTSYYDDCIKYYQQELKKYHPSISKAPILFSLFALFIFALFSFSAYTGYFTSEDSFSLQEDFTTTLDSNPIYINFTDPTPNNNTISRNFTHYFNVSLNSVSKLRNFIWKWDGINYSIYDNNLIWHLNFENNTPLLENQNIILDTSLYSRNLTIVSSTSVFDDFEANLGGWSYRDGFFITPVRNCTVSQAGSCSVMLTTTSGWGSSFINTSSYSKMNSRIEFDYKCESSDFKWGVMVYDGSWNCIQGTSTATCGGAFPSIGSFFPAIVCDNTWRHAYHNLSAGSGTISQTIIGDWGSNTPNYYLWIDNFNIRDNIYTSGKNGNGLYLDGDNYFTSGGVFPELGTTNQPYSYSLWFNAASGETDGNLIQLASLYNGYGWCLPPLAIDASKITAYSYNSATITAADNVSIATGNWYHAASTWDSTNGLKLYVNGILRTTTPQAAYTASGASNYIRLGFGGNGCVGDQGYFNGTLDQIQVWNRSLTSTEVQQIYNSHLVKYNSSTWNFNNNQTLSYGNYSYSSIALNTDSISSSTENRTLIITSANFAPTISSLIVNSSLGTNTTDENLTAYATTSDVNGDPVKVIYDWRKNGNSIAVLNLPFENNGTNNSNKDYSSFGNNISSTGGAVWNATSGADGKGAFNFNGTTTPLTIANSASLQDVTEGSYTWGAWYYPLSYGSGLPTHEWQSLICKKGFPTGLFYKNDSYFYLAIRNTFNTEYGLNSNGIYPSNNWYHVVGSLNNVTRTLKFYINGELVNSTSYSGTLKDYGTNPIRIGGCDTSGAAYDWIANGTIDNVFIYPYELSPQQIQALYNNRTDLIVSQETSLSENWTVQATPNDGFVDGLASLSNSLIISESSPPIVGITLDDDSIAFGSGYYNASCTSNLALINSNSSKDCWINTTEFPVNDMHLITNNGTVNVNVSSYVLLTDAEQAFCGSSQGCTLTDLARIAIISQDNEVGSCSGLNAYGILANHNSNATQGVCNSLGTSDASDQVRTYIELFNPKDSSPGAKSITIVYEAMAV
jgi:hypothetical protein